MRPRRAVLAVLVATVALVLILNVLFAALRAPEVDQVASVIRQRNWKQHGMCADVSQRCSVWCALSRGVSAPMELHPGPTMTDVCLLFFQQTHLTSVQPMPMVSCLQVLGPNLTIRLPTYLHYRAASGKCTWHSPTQALCKASCGLCPHTEATDKPLALLMEMPGYETLSMDTHHKQQAFLAARRASPSAQKVLTLCMSLAVRAAGPLAATQGQRSWLFPLILLSSKICYIAGPDAQPATLSSDNADLQAR